jgi:hypothetical protein
LQNWGFDDLAIALWEQVLADEASIRLQARSQGEQVRARALDIRTRLAALKIARAESFEAEVLTA